MPIQATLLKRTAVCDLKQGQPRIVQLRRPLFSMLKSWDRLRSKEKTSLSIPIIRIDRLNEAARQTLRLAAVIGRSFYLRVLEAIQDYAPPGSD